MICTTQAEGRTRDGWPRSDLIGEVESIRVDARGGVVVTLRDRAGGAVSLTFAGVDAAGRTFRDWFLELDAGLARVGG